MSWASRLDHELGLLDVDKSCLLVVSMENPTAKQRTQDAVDCTSSFAEAVELLKSYYDDNRLLHRHYLEQLTRAEQFGSRIGDLDYPQTKLNSTIKGFKDCNGYIA